MDRFLRGCAIGCAFVAASALLCGLIVGTALAPWPTLLGRTPGWFVALLLLLVPVVVGLLLGWLTEPPRGEPFRHAARWPFPGERRGPRWGQGAEPRPVTRPPAR